MVLLLIFVAALCYVAGATMAMHGAYQKIKDRYGAKKAQEFLDYMRNSKNLNN